MTLDEITKEFETLIRGGCVLAGIDCNDTEEIVRQAGGSIRAAHQIASSRIRAKTGKKFGQIG